MRENKITTSFKLKARNSALAIFALLICSVVFLHVASMKNISSLSTILHIPKAQAANGVPLLINFQGKLTNVSGGTNVANGSYNSVFKIYTVASGGTAVWTETWNASSSQVSVTNGVFNVKLGTYTDLSTVDFTGDTLYLGVNFNADGEMTPRKRLTSAPYALNANNLVGSGRISTTYTATSSPGASITYNPSASTSNNALSVTAGSNVTGPALQVTNNGSGYAAILTGGYVGIGTTSPTSTLFVQGSAAINPFIVASSTGTSLFTISPAGNVTAAGTINGLTVSGGTISSGTWNGSVIGASYGGTGTNTLASLLVGSNLSITGGQSVLIGTSTTISLGTNVVTSVVNDTNVTGSIASNALTLGWTGQLSVARGGTGASTLTGILKGNGTSAVTALQGTTGYVTRWSDANTLATGILLDNATVAGVNATSSSYTFNVQGASATDPFNIASSTGTALLTVKQTGNVGIGTSTPTAQLHVIASAAGTKGLIIGSAASQSANLLEFQNSSGTVLANFLTTGAFAGPDGGTSTPTLRGQSSTNTGIYFPSTLNGVGVTYAGTLSALIGQPGSFPGLALRSDGQIMFGNTAPLTSNTMDTGIARDSAGVLRVSNGGSGMASLLATSIAVNSTTIASTLFVQGTGSTNPFSITSSTGGSLLHMAPTGYVGIATSTETATLHLAPSIAISSGTTTTILRVEPTMTGTVASTAHTALYGSYTVPAINLGNATSTITSLYNSYHGLTVATGTITSWYGTYIAAPTGSGTITNKYSLVTEASAGNVGVGTTTPANLLTVASTASDIAYFRSSNSSYTGVGIANSGTNGKAWQLLAAGTSASIGNGNFAIWDADNGAARMVVDSSGRVGIGTTTPATKLSVVGTAGAANSFTIASSTGATVFNVTGAGLINTASVGTGALKTATGASACSPASVCSVTGNDYSFAPSLTTSGSEDCLAAITNTSNPNNTILRIRFSQTDCLGINPTGGTSTANWRYITASDHPTIWVIANADGSLSGTAWEAEDPVDQAKWPENPNPLEGTPLKDGQYFASPAPVSLNQLQTLFGKFPNADIQQVMHEVGNYYVTTRHWLNSFNSLDDINHIDPRFQPAAREWAFRYLAKHYQLSPPEAIGTFLHLENGSLASNPNPLQDLAALHQKEQAVAAAVAAQNAIPGNIKKSDVAEWYHGDIDLNPGDVITNEATGVAKVHQGYDKNIMGVISTSPGVLLGKKQTADDVRVALTGRVPVKVTTENGPIEPGDYITSSKQFPGYGMKATHSGQVIGQALEAFTGTSTIEGGVSVTGATSGTVLAFLNIGYQVVNNSFVLEPSQLTGTVGGGVASSTNTSFLINQKGSGDILQLQTAGMSRFMVRNDGSVLVNASSTLVTDKLVVVKNNDAEVFSINARGDASIKGTIFIADNTFAGSIATNQDGESTITFSYDLGTGKPVIELTPEAATPIFAQVVSWQKDAEQKYTGVTIKTFGLAGTPQSAIVHYIVVGKGESYTTQGSVIPVISAPQTQTSPPPASEPATPNQATTPSAENTTPATPAPTTGSTEPVAPTGPVTVTGIQSTQP